MVRKNEAQFTIVATGFLSAHTGIHELLAAFSLLEGAQYCFILAGRGPLEDAVAEAAARDPRIHFKGFLDVPDLLDLHANADVLISMRVTQTVRTAYAFPSKTFEYLLSGVPVITTATGHMKDEYGPYCFILEDETPDALAALLHRIEQLGPFERARIGLAAHRFIIDHKAWEVQHTRIAEYVRSQCTTTSD